MDKPTLQEIADMPHTEGVIAMRAHYDPNWPMVTEDAPEGETLKEYKIEVDYSYISSGDEIVTVRAYTDEEAKKLAETAAASKINCDGWELEGIKILSSDELDG